MPELKKKEKQKNHKKEESFGNGKEKVKINRVSSGIKGMDELMEGGIPEKFLVLVSGQSGTGKSTFGLNYAIEGALKNEPALYVALEEEIEEIVMQMKLFGWPVEQMLEEKKLLITKPSVYDFEKLLTHIEDMATKINAKRIVLDSFSIIGMFFKEEFRIRKALFDLAELVKKLETTTLVISEVKENTTGISTYGIEEFVADGVIVLYLTRKENIFSRGIAIRKMRSTNHSLKIHPIQIHKNNGITVYATEETFAEF